MKQINFFLSRFLLFVSLLVPLLASAGTTFTIGDLDYEITSDNTVEVVNCSRSYTGAIKIPTTVSYEGIQYSVTSIGIFAFSGCSGLTTLTIPNSVTLINNDAFNNCSAIKKVILEDGNTALEFRGGIIPMFHSASLQEVYLGRNLVGDMPFLNQTSLTSLTITKSVTSIASYSFYDCSSLSTLTIPNSVTSINTCAFYNCSGLKKVILEDADTPLEFGGGEGLNPMFHTALLEEVYLGRNLSYGSSEFAPFREQSNLNSLIISNSVTRIEEDEFCGCTGLTSITIPNSVTTIRDCAFYGCTGLTSITIPNSVTSINEGAFYHCSGLKKIVFEDGDTSLYIGWGEHGKVNNAYYSYPMFKYASIEEVYLGRSIKYSNSECAPFHDQTSLTLLSIGNSVTSIEDSSFSGCTALTSLIIPDSVKSIGSGAFYNCSRLYFLTIGNSVTSTGKYSFYNCTNLTTIIFGDSMTSIDDGSFSGCTGLTSLTLPNSVTSIGNDAFSSCEGLTNVTIPNSVTTIGERAFLDCSGLTSLTIPNSVTSIDYCAFYNCFGLKKVILEDADTPLKFGRGKGLNPMFHTASLQEVFLGRNLDGDMPFCQQKNLTSVTISNSVTTIGNRAFMGCSGLSSLTIPNSVTSIGEKAFSGCDGLISFTIPNAVTSIGNEAFSDCNFMKKISISEGEQNLEFGSNCFLNVPMISLYLGRNFSCTSTKVTEQPFSGNASLRDLIIGDYVTFIGKSAFYGCNGLISLTIPDAVNFIDDYAFSGCSSLTLITISDGEQNLEFGEDCFRNVPLNSVYLGREFSCTSSKDSEQPFRGNMSLEKLTIGKSVIFLMENAFSDCISLADITISDAEQNLEFEANCFKNVPIESLYLGRVFSCTAPYYESTKQPFRSKNSLINLTIGDSVTEISESSFSDCKGITSLNLGNSVISIGRYAFYECSGLTSLTIPNSVTTIGDAAFFRCKGLTSLTLGNSVNSIGSSAFYDCSGLTSLIIPESVTTIGDNAFNSCSNLVSVSIGASVTSIGPSAFYECSGLTSLTIGNSVKSIGGSAFYGCTGLTSLTIPDSVTYINNYAFSGCTGLTSLVIGNAVTSVGDNAFNGCSSLSSLILGNSTTSIGGAAFSRCSSLTSLTIPESVTYIYNHAFSGCTGLTDIIISDGNKELGFGSNCFEEAPLESLYLGRNFFNQSRNSEYPFSGKHSLSKLTIGDSVTSICEYAFEDCTGLTSLTLPKSVASLCEYSFSGCIGLTSLIIPRSVTSIGNSAFSGCSGLKDIIISDGDNELEFQSNCFADIPLESLYLGRNISYVSSKSEYPFNGKLSLSKLTIGDSVTSISNYAFEDCTGLTSLTLPESVSTIGESAFSGCIGLTSLTIPKSVNRISEKAFSNCTGLTEIAISDNDESLVFEAKCFYNVPIKSLYLGRNFSCSTSYDSDQPFRGNTTLTSLTIGDSVSSIGDKAFEGCFDLKNITISEGEQNLEFGVMCFNNIPLESLYLGRDFSCPSSYASYQPFSQRSSLTSLTIGNTVTSIGDLAFAGCNSLTSLVSNAELAPTISLDTFGAYTKYNSEVNIPDGSELSYKNKWSFFKQFETSISSENTYTVSFPGNLINQLPLDKVEEFRSLKLIGAINGTDILVLNKCINLIQLDLSEASIVSGGMPYYEKDNIRFGTEDNTLGDMWAYNLDNLSWVNLPNTLLTIGANAFKDKSMLLEMVIPNSVTTINSSAFSGCRELSSLTIPNSVSHIADRAFYGCRSLNEITISDSVGVLEFGAYCFSNVPMKSLYLGRNFQCSSLKDYEQPFRGKSDLTNLTIGDSVTSIGDNTFYSCSGLTSLILGNSVTYIGESAFEGCNSLTLLIIPDAVTNIGGRAFYGCSNMNSLVIGNSVNSIGNSAFYGCRNLKDISISDAEHDVVLGANCFYNVPMESLYLGRDFSCTSSKDSDQPFKAKTTLISLTIGNNVSYIGGSAFEGCRNLNSLTIPNSIISIGSSAFLGCSGLTSLTIGNSVCSIGTSAFEGCSGLTSVNIPDPMQKLNDNVFANCLSLESITLPGSMRSISASAFSSCSELKSVKVINPIPPVIESSTFADAKSASLSVPEGSRNIYWIHPYWGKFGNISVWGGNENPTFASAGISYQVTSEEDATVEITAANLLGRSADLEIPAEVSFNDKTYRVTGVANNGFENIAVASIGLPSTISYVGLEAFKGCAALSRLECNAVTPPSVYSNSFDESTYSVCQLKVPEEAQQQYKYDAVWGRFSISDLIIDVESIHLDPTIWSGSEGESFQITASVAPANATDKSLVWTSSDEEIATVDESGMVTVHKIGQCVITATAADGSGVEATCQIDVTTGVAVIGDEAEPLVSIYDLSGTCLFSNVETDRVKSLDKGIYIIVSGNVTKKIAVK